MRPVRAATDQCFSWRARASERGDTGGIVVARLDRFARSAVDALEGIKRLNEAGARLVSVEDNFDGSTPMGRFAIGILTLIRARAPSGQRFERATWTRMSRTRSSRHCEMKTGWLPRLSTMREKVAALRAQAVVAEDVLSGDPLETWPELTIPERRQLMHGLLEKVVLTRSDERNKATLKPIQERTTIVLRGGQSLQPSATSAST
jgi:Resolvase, N terminal domain